MIFAFFGSASRIVSSAKPTVSIMPAAAAASRNSEFAPMLCGSFSRISSAATIAACGSFLIRPCDFIAWIDELENPFRNPLPALLIASSARRSHCRPTRKFGDSLRMTWSNEIA